MTIVTSFNSASAHYDASAQLQTEVATRLIASAAVESPRSILDIGCGTGILTALAQQRWPTAQITAIDAAPLMLERARAKLSGVSFVQGDASDIALAQTFDLVLSSMVLHWLDAPDEVVARWRNLLASGGTMLIALPVEGSLAEWDDLCALHGAPSRIWRFPQSHQFGGEMSVHPHVMAYPSAHVFLRSMKDTGAAISNPATGRTSPDLLRRMMARAPSPFTATFHIAYWAETKAGPHF